MQFKKGATPTITFHMDVSPYLFTICHIAFSQFGQVKFIKTLADCEILDETTMRVKLTEEDTLKLHGGTYVSIQLRVEYIDGTKDASDILQADVGDILEGGALSDEN